MDRHASWLVNRHLRRPFGLPSKRPLTARLRAALAAVGVAAVVGAAFAVVAVAAASSTPGDVQAQGNPTAPSSIVVRDDTGQVVKLAAPARRIVSLLPSLTEAVCALGACERLVGTDRYSNWPASVRALPKLGGMDDAQIERIVALKPDLVLAARSTRATERLRSLGQTVVALDSDTHADVERSLNVIAALIGQPQDAVRAWARIERQLQQAANQLPAGWRGRRVYFEIGSTPYAAGTLSFIGQTMRQLGLSNIVPAELGAFPKINPEFVVRQQPEVLMGTARDVQQMASRPGWAAMAALRNGQVCAFDAATFELMTRPGPRLGDAAEALVDCLRRLSAPV